MTPYDITNNVWVDTLCPGAPFTNIDWLKNPSTDKLSHAQVWDEITYPFPNFNGYTVEVWEWISYFIPHFEMDVIIFPFWNWISIIMVIVIIIIFIAAFKNTLRNIRRIPFQGHDIYNLWIKKTEKCKCDVAQQSHRQYPITKTCIIQENKASYQTHNICTLLQRPIS